MSEVKILRLELRNFKGQRHLDLDFGGSSCTIYGKNGSGKTSVYDAFSWLLFGVNSLGESGFNIKPLDKNGQVMDHGAVTSVEADLLVNGEHHNLKRTYYEKWSRKRGAVNESYDGNTSDYFLDEVPVKKKAFDEAVQKMVGTEQTFHTLTDLRRFCTVLSWKERRNLLMDMCWNTTDQAVMEQDERFQTLLEAMGGRSLDDYRSMLDAKRKNLSGARNKIPTRLDELSRVVEGLPECDYDAAREEIACLQAQMRELQMAADKSGCAALLDQAERQLGALEEQRHLLEQSNRDYQAGVPRPDLGRLRREADSIASRIQSARTGLELSRKDTESWEAELEELRSRWAERKNQVFQGSVCPTCGQALPPDQLQKAWDEFKATQQQDLEVIEKRAARRKERILAEKKRFRELERALEADGALLQKARAALKEAEEQEAQPVPNLPGYIDKRSELDKQIRECLDRVAELQKVADGSDFKNKAAQIEAKIREKEALLADERTIQNAARRRAELEDEQEKAAAALEELDNLLYLCDEFTRYKVQLVDDTVSGCFRLVRFKLFHEQVNGGLADCCEAMVNGVPYKDLNKGAKMNAGIDIIRTLSDYYGVKVPLFIDNSESVTEIEEAGTQVICLEVSKQDKELRLAV